MSVNKLDNGHRQAQDDEKRKEFVQKVFSLLECYAVSFGKELTDISKDRRAFEFKVKESRKSDCMILKMNAA
jgi:hypothetical protein